MDRRTCLVAALLLGGTIQGRTEEPPVSLLLGEVTAQDVHIRTGPTTNCEDVAKAARGDLFLVRDERFGWLQVDLPLWATAWVHEDLIKLELEREEMPLEREKGKELPPGEEEAIEETALEPSLEEFLCFGVVTSDRVNLRSRPGLTHTTLGQSNAGTRVRCTGRYGEWIRIQAPPGQTGWVHGDLLDLRPLHMSSLELEEQLSNEGALLVYGRCGEEGFLLHPLVGPFAKLKNEDLASRFEGQTVLLAARCELGEMPETPPLLQVLAAQTVPRPETEAP